MTRSLVCGIALSLAAATGCVDPEEDPALGTADQAVMLPGYQMVIAEGPLSTAASQQLTVSCPSGTVAVGAGQAAVDAGNVFWPSVTTASLPSWDGRRWLVNLRRERGPSPWKIRASVACAAPPAGYDVRLVDSAYDAALTRQQNTACAAGSVATGAGFAILDRTGVFIDGEPTSFMPAWDGTSWLVNARPLVPGVKWKLRTALICADAAALPGYEVVTASSALDTASLKEAQPSCPTGKAATGAGWSALDPTYAILEGRSRVHASGYDGTYWISQAENLSGFSPAWQLHGRAICVL